MTAVNVAGAYDIHRSRALIGKNRGSEYKVLLAALQMPAGNKGVSNWFVEWQPGHSSVRPTPKRCCLPGYADGSGSVAPSLAGAVACVIFACRTTRTARSVHSLFSSNAMPGSPATTGAKSCAPGYRSRSCWRRPRATADNRLGAASMRTSSNTP